MPNMNLEESLNDFMRPEESQDRERFVVDNYDKANWVVNLMSMRKKEIAEKQEFAERQIQRIQEWLEKEIAPLQQTIEWGEMVLRPFAENEIALAKKKTKTLRLPFANLSFKKPSTKYERDDTKLISFVSDNVDNAEQFLDVTTKLKWGELKKVLVEADDGKLVTQDGIVVEGVTWERAEVDDFKVDLKGE